ETAPHHRRTAFDDHAQAGRGTGAGRPWPELRRAPGDRNGTGRRLYIIVCAPQRAHNARATRRLVAAGAGGVRRTFFCKGRKRQESGEGRACGLAGVEKVRRTGTHRKRIWVWFVVIPCAAFVLILR